jgi:N-acetylneuraminic acid mutarotase
MRIERSIIKLSLKKFGRFFPFSIVFLIISCEKKVTPSRAVSVSGPINVCPGQTGIIYSVELVADVDYYLWTVPEGSKILSGQGTNAITIEFGKSSGSVCVRTNNGEMVSENTCLEVAQGGLSGQWCRQLNFAGGNREQGVAFSIGNKGYFGTGLDGSTRYNDFWEFDPMTNSWSQKANLPSYKRIAAVGFSIGNRGYIGTGESLEKSSFKSNLSDFWEYNPETNSWVRKANYGVADTNGCGYCSAFSIGDKAYVGGGIYKAAIFTATGDFFEFSPNDGPMGKWIKKANTTFTVSSGVGFAIEGKGYFGTGSNLSVTENKFIQYDPASLANGTDVNGNPMGKWEFKKPVPGPGRYNAIGFSIGNRGYLLGGENVAGVFNDFYEYDPDINDWITKSSPPTSARRLGKGFSIGKNGYIGLGNNVTSGTLNDFWVYGQ